MKDRDFETRFPWTFCFLACSLCYLGFVRVMRWINVSIPSFFFWIGTGSLLLAAFSWIFSMVQRNQQAAAATKNPSEA